MRRFVYTTYEESVETHTQVDANNGLKVEWENHTNGRRSMEWHRPSAELGGSVLCQETS